MKFDVSQKHAINKALTSRFWIITGAAGTGKTTIINEIVERYNFDYDILAPTGKAAARLREITSKDASTIHRALYYDGDSFNRNAPFSGMVIVDEASMVDLALLAEIIKLEPKQLILVGDFAQLPPVGAGQPFHDLIKSKPECVTTLQKCYRADGAIHIACNNIREGKLPPNKLISGGEAWTMIETGEAGATMGYLSAWVKKGQFDPENDLLLSPRYGSGENGDGGIDAINTMVKGILNPSPGKYKEGDRILCLKNFAKDNMWNGDIGTVQDVTYERKNIGSLWVAWDKDKSEIVELTREQVRETKLAYCLSIHKAQGSECRRVFMVVLTKHHYQLSRSLLYTGVTRAKEGVCILGEKQAVIRAINHVNHKRTILKHLCRGQKDEVRSSNINQS
ncbi:MAG TPA: hypothetical protein ENH82_19275 [bacterium]|nr:hypothetical protein [bacterium]